MTNSGEMTGRRRWSRWRIAGWSIPVLLLLLPLIAMRFTAEVNWTASDFVFASVLFGSVGLAFEFIVHQSRSLAYRLGAGLTVITAFLTVWVNAAVGMIGSEDNPYNLAFGAVLTVALIGAVVARFRAAGMTHAMVVTAIAQAMVGAIGIASDPSGGALSMTFAMLWLLAAAFFWNAGRAQAGQVQ